ncbi:MAG: hypothetical protein K2W85_14500, partial [Phycisphaerales bacterium]|nr:hypothetical protein [Phycisphaerales bacterium]
MTCRVFYAVVGLLFASATSLGGVNVRYFYRDGVSTVQVDTSQPGPDATITRSIMHNGSSRAIFAAQVWADSPLTEDIGAVSITPTSGNFVTITLRTPSLGAACRNLGGNWNGSPSFLSETGVSVRIQGEIFGNLTGGLAADQISTMAVQGRILGNVHSRGRDSGGTPTPTIVEAGAVAPGVTIRAVSTQTLFVIQSQNTTPGLDRNMDGVVINEIGNVTATWTRPGATGNWRGDLLAPNGRITELQLVNGGQIATRPGGSRPIIRAKELISQVVADSIDADIEVTERGPSMPEPIGYIERVQALNGSITGSVLCRRFSLTSISGTIGGVRATGALSASLTSSIQDTTIGVSEISPGALVRTGRFATGLPDTQSDIVLLNAMGLKGQIILGQVLPPPNPPPLPPPPPYTWVRRIFVGGQEILHTPEGEYNIPSAQLGGGAVGLAPFRLYRADSVPTATAPGA